MGSDADASVASMGKGKAGWSGFQHTSLHAQKADTDLDNMRKVIMLDSGTTVSLFCEESLVENIRKSNCSMNLATNAGSKIIDNEADVKGFGTVKYDPKSIANIFGLCDLKKKYRVTLDTSKEDAFLVHTNQNGIIRFEANGSGLYVYKPSEKFVSDVARREKQSVGL